MPANGVSGRVDRALAFQELCADTGGLDNERTMSDADGGRTSDEAASVLAGAFPASRVRRLLAASATTRARRAIPSTSTAGGDGSVAVLRRLSPGRAGTRGLRPGDDGRAVALRLRARERSSRAIERACDEDVAYRVIAANQEPDHATIARFRRAPRAGARRPVRRGVGLVRRRRVGEGRRWSRSTAPRCTANASRDADARLRADRARDPRGGAPNRRARGRAVRRAPRR